MNIQENINRIKEVMGLEETIDVPSDSYISMNIKNFPIYKKEISNLLQDKLQASNRNFVKFKNSVIDDKNPYAKTPILSKDLQGKYTFLKVDGGTDATVMKEIGASVLPTFMVYKNGKLSWKKEGIVTLEELKEALKK
jgi:hypothetical protein